MLWRGKRSSAKRLQSQQKNSVYDFLYQDVRRVASFLSQFQPHGVSNQAKITASVASTAARRTSLLGSVGFPAIIGSSGTREDTNTAETRDLAEHTFDPLWSNSRKLLDYLATHDLINKDLWGTPVGRFILVTGSICISDVGLLQASVKNPMIKDSMLQNELDQAGVDLQSPKGQEMRNNYELFLSFPANIQLFIFAANCSVWSSLSSESLVTSSADLSYKHGALLRGEWSVLGILDALPDIKPEANPDNPTPKTLRELSEELVSPSVSGLAHLSVKLSNGARDAMGRPAMFFGVTPLLIFREVTG